MTAVIWTDFIQSIAILIVAFTALFTAVHLSGGWGRVYHVLKLHNMTVGDHFFEWHPFTPPNHPGSPTFDPKTREHSAEARPSSLPNRDPPLVANREDTF
jgi:hypothetical protein